MKKLMAALAATALVSIPIAASAQDYGYGYGDRASSYSDRGYGFRGYDYRYSRDAQAQAWLRDHPRIARENQARWLARERGMSMGQAYAFMARWERENHRPWGTPARPDHYRGDYWR